VLNIIELLTLLNVELSASLSVESLSFGFSMLLNVELSTFNGVED
jgi:hypothetical protein